jgi:hypothetical protein
VSVGQSVCEVDLECCECGCLGTGGPPFRFGSFDGEVDELGGGLFVGEVAAGLDRLADLAVHGLDRVGRVDNAAQLVGQREERRDVLPVAPPALGDHRVALAPGLVEALELGLGGLGIGGAVDRPERGRDLAPVLVGHVAQRAPDLVDDAGLHPGLGEDGRDRFGEAGQAVDAGD